MFKSLLSCGADRALVRPGLVAILGVALFGSSAVGQSASGVFMTPAQRQAQASQHSARSVFAPPVHIRPPSQSNVRRRPEQYARPTPAPTRAPRASVAPPQMQPFSSTGRQRPAAIESVPRVAASRPGVDSRRDVRPRPQRLDRAELPASQGLPAPQGLPFPGVSEVAETHFDNIHAVRPPLPVADSAMEVGVESHSTTRLHRSVFEQGKSFGTTRINRERQVPDTRRPEMGMEVEGAVFELRQREEGDEVWRRSNELRQVENVNYSNGPVQDGMELEPAAVQMGTFVDEIDLVADDGIEIVPPMVTGFSPSGVEPPVAPPIRQARLDDLGIPRPRQARLDKNGRPMSILEGAEVKQPRRLRTVRSRNSLRLAGQGNLRGSRQETLPSPDGLGDLYPSFQTTAKTCDEFRERLLGVTIQDIALDISPPKSMTHEITTTTRTWKDRRGVELGTGTMVDLRRGYVFIETVDGVKKFSMGKLGDADLAAVSAFWNVPVPCTIGYQEYVARAWVPQTMTWKASGLCHKPLYFEDVQLERYGHSRGPFLQPLHSTVHFFASVFVWPYQTAIHPPSECQFALGYYRPGDCAPWLRDPLPISLRGAVRQAVVITGLSVMP